MIQFFLNTKTAIATQLRAKRDDQVIIGMDGTYLFVQKSSDNVFQRRSYSMHKHRNLVKPMIITATVSECSIDLYCNDPTPYGIGRGYLLSVSGAFLADGKNNDASIAESILKNKEENILGWLEEDGVIVVDRGFRDAVETMNQLGFNVQMSDFLKGKKQLFTMDANHARSVTKVRWVIEAGMQSYQAES